MLGERGIEHEAAVIEGARAALMDLSGLTPADKEATTRAAIADRHPLIYGGRIRHDDLVGEPDLLRFTGAGYQAGDIKSGAGFEGDAEEGKLRVTYPLQLALY